MSKMKNLILMLAVSLMLSGCGGNKPVSIDETQSVSEDSAVSENASVAEETVLNTENQEPSDSQEEYLPEGFTMDDLLNMIQIDGKTLSMPTTLENILTLNDDFTCEMAFSDLYASPEDSINDLGGVFYDIKYKNEKLFQIVISKDDYNGDYMTSRIYKFSSLLNVENFKKDNLNFKRQLSILCSLFYSLLPSHLI